MMGGQPIIILKEGTEREKGKGAVSNNIAAARAVADAVKSTLGPKGMDKMLVDSLGDVTITNDGVTILKEIEIEHPTAKMLVEVAKTQDDEVGDGTTSAVILAGELLKAAESLIESEVHPTIIVNGYRMAAAEAVRRLNQLAFPVKRDDKTTLRSIARTAMSGRSVGTNADFLAGIAVDAVQSIVEEVAGELRADVDNILVQKKHGGSLSDTNLIDGVVLDKERVHPRMPKFVRDAKIALINRALEVKKTEVNEEIRIRDPGKLQLFLNEEEKSLKTMVDKIKASGANVVLCQKGIDDIAQHYLAKEGMIAVRRIKESDMAKLAKATGAKIITNTEEISKDDIGHADLIEERNVEDDKWVFIEGCKNPKSITILIRGGSQRVVDEAERSIHDALMVIKDAVEYPYLVVGGGAPEVVVSKKLREWSSSLASRQQLAVEKYADALESIPLTLAENAGMSLVDAQAELRTKSQTTGKPRFGVDVFKGKIVDLSSRDVYELLSVKNQVINSGTEAACMILRIDDIISAGAPKGGSNPPGGGGYGGMPE